MERFFIKLIEWNEEKNEILKIQRRIWFEDIMRGITSGKIYNIEEKHYNVEKYPKQKILFIENWNYIYIVPFVEDEERIFFKTIIPSRKYTKKYLN